MTKKKGIIYETLGSTAGLQVMESRNPNEVRLSGVFGVCGIKNGNNRIYEKANYGKMVSLMQERMKGEAVLGELEHPNTMNITLENVSHKIEEITMNEDGTVTGTICLLNTPKGKIAKAIIEGGAPLYISSRGAGSIDESGHVTLTQLQTYDLVGTPGFSQAKLTLKNDQKFEALNESLENPAWMIVESEEEDPLDLEDEPAKDEKPEDEKDKKKKKENNEKPEDDKKGDEDITMEDVKNSIDELSQKVEKLEAELHIAKESLEIAEKKVVNYKAIQQWIEEEFAPKFRENCINEMNDATNTAVMNLMKESILPNIQTWIVEEFAPQVEDWTIREFGQQVENWIAEEYSGSLQTWVVEQFAPQVEKWINEEYSGSLQKWLNEEFAPEHAKIIEDRVNKNVNDFMEAQKETKYDSIDKMLEMLEQNAGNADKILESQQKDKYSGIAIVEGMPANYRPLWEGLSDEKKDAIIRESRMYDMTRPGAVDKFWSTRQLTSDTIIESRQAPAVQTVQESKGASIVAQMKRIGGKL